MFCNQCGKEIPDHGKFCPACGSAISGVSSDSGVEKSLGEFKTLVHENQPQEGGSSGLTVSMLSERYELGPEIGRGGFAAVFRATDKKLNRAVAIKKLHPEQADATTMARFRREALAIASLNHRNIVQVYDVGEDPSDGSLFLVMELIEGGSLREHLKKQDNQRFPLAEATALLRGIGQGLSHAHRKNLVHRDIKPANILLQKEGNEWVPKIVDFGLAQAGRDSELSMSGYGMGTAYYMPPEQRRDAKSVNHTADVYALGKVFYEMVTGELPDTLDPAEIPPPKALADLIFKCVKPKPEDRFFSVDELLGELDGIGLAAKERKGTQKQTVAAGNECPNCGVANGKEIKFCVGCGGGLFIDCPECDKENSIGEKFCGSCGTEVEGFLAVQEVVSRINRYAAEKKWSRVLKEAEGFKNDFRLPGEKGKALLSSVEKSAEQANQTLKEISNIEQGISREAIISKGNSDEGTVHDEGNDDELLKALAALSKLKALSAEQQHDERAVKSRLAEVKKQAVKARKHKIQKIAAGVVVLVLAGFAIDQIVLATHKSSFKNAVEHKQLDKAQTAAEKLGGRFNTAGDLDALKNCLAEKETLERLLAGQRELLAKYGGADWQAAGEKIRLAEKPGSPVESATAYREAIPLVQQVQAQMADMLQAEAAFSTVWKTSGDVLKKFEPATYAQLNDGVVQVKALVDPVAAKTGWKKLAADVATAQQKIAKLDAAKSGYEATVAKVGADLLKQYGKADWDNAQQSVKKAEASPDLKQAIGLWNQATDSVEKAAGFVIPLFKVTGDPKNVVSVQRTERGGPVLKTDATGWKLKKDEIYTLTVSKQGYKTHTETLVANWYGLKEKRVELEGQTLPNDLAEVAAGASVVGLTRLAPGSRDAQSAQKAAVSKNLPMEVESVKTGIKFRLIPAGSFTMGSPSGETGRASDENQHRVTLTQPFYCGKFEVTQAQWKQVMDTSPSKFSGSQNPVEQVSWDDCQGFLKKLCALEGVPAGTYRLLTEAQWEYACRAGTSTPFCYGSKLDSSQANFAGNYPYGGASKGAYRKKTVSIGKFKPNAFGLYDMHGNVWEWCGDWYSDGYGGDVVDPQGSSSGSSRIRRGGSWYNYSSYCRSADRDGSSPDFRDDYFSIGFRLQRTLP